MEVGLTSGSGFTTFSALDASPTTTAEVVLKRRPGRPKGSGKKDEHPGNPPKMKRPVGRPRKDGFPAGSVGPPRPIKRKSPAPPAVQSTSINAKSPAGDIEEWAILAQTSPNEFLVILLQALYAPNPVSTSGSSVEEAFKSHLVSLSPTSSQNHHTPTLYSIMKTFWLPSSPAYFSLTASAPTSRTPSEHRFLYWDPQPLVFNGISCPSCASPLHNNGRIRSGPIKIYDIEKPFFIIACEYNCTNGRCMGKWASTDWSILRSLPGKLRDEFPARLVNGETDAGSGPEVWNWQGMGVSVALWNMVKGCLKTGMRKEAILAVIRSIQVGDDDEDAPMADPIISASNSDGTLTDGTTNTSKDTSFTEYQKAWEANSAANELPVPPSAAGLQPIAPIYPNAQAMRDLASQFSFQFSPFSFTESPPPTTASPPEPSPPIPQTQQNSLKRVHPFEEEEGSGSGSLAPTVVKKRSPRHCVKCGLKECKGKGGRMFCHNACQDCGKLDCQGRNSRRPDKRCNEGWAGL